MTRVHRWEGVIALEGVETVDGRLLNPWAVQWGLVPIPVFARLDDQDVEPDGYGPVGRIGLIYRRGREGRRTTPPFEIWADGVVDLDLVRHLVREDAELAMLAAEVDLDEAKLDASSFSEGDGLIRVHSGLLRRMTFGTNPAWPEVWVTIGDLVEKEADGD